MPIHTEGLKPVTGFPISHHEWLRDASSIDHDPIPFRLCRSVPACLRLYMKSLTCSRPYERTGYTHVVSETDGLITIGNDQGFIMGDKPEMSVSYDHMATPNINARANLPICRDLENSIHRSESERIRLIEALLYDIADPAPLKRTGKRQEMGSIDGPASFWLPCQAD